MVIDRVSAVIDGVVVSIIETVGQGESINNLGEGELGHLGVKNIIQGVGDGFTMLVPEGRDGKLLNPRLIMCG